MAKFNINLAYSALLCVAVAVNLAQALNDGYDLAVINGYLNAYEKQVLTMNCMERSCDPLALQKIVEIENEVEKDLKARSTLFETHEIESVKVLRAIEATVGKMLLAVPECHDLSYSCPSKSGAIQTEPNFLSEYSTITHDIIKYGRSCVNLNNVQEAIKILGDAVEYVEQENPNEPGNYFQRAMPARRFIANEYSKLCKGNPWVRHPIY
ncbi:uncharacterized protein LOC106082882 [Stomoxys calcitrans]|uniref:uncharacterized protein LOC106082882 n=1 Tax=Stomoxys calcitrans TaxID=35570 RepID=UPI0027E220DA|nr:uncharacterized protein LOC106082882 [Stomoxys calcitrans]